MKIGIVTLPLITTNYGCVLQAFALQTLLVNMGNYVNFICLKDPYKHPLWQMPLRYGKRILLNLRGRKVPILLEQKEKKEGVIIRQNIDAFIKKYIHQIKYDKFSDIQENVYDVLIVGSDQVWRPKYSVSLKDNYLDFAKKWNVKRISYAASFGTENWEYSSAQTRQCARLIKLFNHISVREASGVKLCKDKFGVDAVQVLDPTMLIDRDYYVKLTESAFHEDSNVLVVYVLDDKPIVRQIVDKIAQTYSLVPKWINKFGNSSSSVYDKVQPSVEQWLNELNNAKFVFTDSFHGTVFSILFNKQFLVYGNNSRGMSRFDSLLGTFNLNNRLVYCADEIKSINKIDYYAVNNILSKEREKSINFLKDSISSSC